MHRASISLTIALFALLLAVVGLGWLGAILPAFDVFSHLRLHCAVLATVLALISIPLSRRMACGAAMLAVVALLGTRVETAGPSPPTVAAARLKVMTLNVFRFAKNSNEIRDLLGRENPDIVLLQEVKGDRLGLLAELRQDYPWQVHCAFEHRCWVAVLSRHPFAAHGKGMLGLHQAGFAWASLGPELDHLTVASVHLRWPLVSDQRGQLAELATEIDGITGPVIVAGDFNAATWSNVLRRFTKSTGLRPAGPFMPTWPARSFSPTRGCPLCFPQLQLDHILVNDRVRVIGQWTGARVDSDHLPLMADVVLRPPEPRRRPLLGAGARQVDRSVTGRGSRRDTGRRGENHTSKTRNTP